MESEKMSLKDYNIIYTIDADFLKRKNVRKINIFVNLYI